MKIKLRKAELADAPLLHLWDKKPHVIAATGSDETYDWEKEIQRNADWQEILMAELDGRPIGVMVIIDPEREEEHYWGDIEPNLRAIDIWIGEESDIGHGYGEEMMAQVLDKIFANPTVKAVLVDPLVSNKNAIDFYERMGFRRADRRMFGEDDCYVYRIKRNDWLNS